MIRLIPLLFALAGCEQTQQKIIEKTDTVIFDTKLNTKMIDSNLMKIDSMLFYMSQRDFTRIKEMEYEVRYYQSGEEKYRRKANKLLDSIKYYHTQFIKWTKK